MDDNYKFRQVLCTRNNSDTNWPRGSMEYKFDINEDESVSLDESYFRIKYTLSKNNGESLLESDLIGVNMFLGDSLFQQQELFINDKCVSKINDYNHEISSIKHRICESDEKMNTYGNSLYYPQSQLNERINLVSANRGGYKRPLLLNYDDSGDADRVYTIRFIAVDNFSGDITFASGGALGVSDVSLIFNVGDELLLRNTILVGPPVVINTFKAQIINIINGTTIRINKKVINEGPVPIKTLNDRLLIRDKNYPIRNYKQNTFCYKPSLGIFDCKQRLGKGKYKWVGVSHPQNDYKRYVIESYVNKVPETDYNFSIDSMELFLAIYEGKGVRSCSFNEIECQSQTLNTSSYNQKEFELTEPAKMLAVAYQDINAGNDTSFSRSKFKIKNEEELNLSLFYLRYNNIQLPDPQSNPQKTQTIDDIADRYYENLYYAKKSLMKDSVEPIDKWFDRGMYFLYKYDKPTKTRVIVSQRFSKEFTDGNSNVLLFSWHKRNVSF